MITRRLIAAAAAALVMVPLGVALSPVSASAVGRAGVAAADRPAADDNPMRIWYTAPVSDWQSQALVQGNGSTGLMAFGNPGLERLHVNDKTLWRGGPAQGRTYIGGNRTTAITPAQLQTYRQALDDTSTNVFGLPPDVANSQLTGLMFGDGNGMGEYQDFGDIYLDSRGSGLSDGAVQNYVRDLDLSTGVSAVDFDQNGVHYKREYFVSYPDKVAVIRLTASQSGALSFTTSTSAAAGLTTTAVAKAAEKRITLQGQVDDNQMKAELQVRIVNDGGTVTSADGKTLSVSGANAVTLVYSTGTDYKNVYPSYRGDAPHARVTSRVDAAAARSYADLRERHVSDHSALFNRVSFDLSAPIPAVPTDELMRQYRAGKYSLAVDELGYQFGRYASIAGSRAGDLPTNLVGFWLIGSAGSFWGADYHFNVNAQMNYWPAMSTNLAETQIPFNDYVESLVVPGRLTADRSAGVSTPNFATTPIGQGNGFLINTQVNPFGHTAPIGSQEYGWNVGGSSWALENLYEYYQFTGDVAYLRDHLYPMLREMALFWDRYLWWSPTQQRLTVVPGVSAEQGPTAVGTSYDQQIVWELYKMAIASSEKLGVDDALRAGWAQKQAQLNPVIIGTQGQVKEWSQETSLGRAQAGSLPEEDIWNFGAGGSANQGAVHRHTSQLIGLYPGTLINKDTPEWMAAARVSLQQRSLNGTGWSKAMKINMYARTGLGDATYQMVRAMLAGNTNGLMDNLLDSHPPFQIDGNYGLTAGMTEMLVQSQLGYTQFLPALPAAWPTGAVHGLVARGNFVIDLDWAAGSATSFRVTARNGGTFVGEYPQLSRAVVKDSAGQVVATTSTGADRISFPTTQGETYVITPVAVVAPTNLALGKPAVQSSTYPADPGGSYTAANAVDGDVTGNPANTARDGQNAWWQVDLGSRSDLQHLVLYNRSDCCTDRLGNLHAIVSENPLPDRALTAAEMTGPGITSVAFVGPAAAAPGSRIDLPAGTTGRYVRIQLDTAGVELNIVELEAFGIPADAAATLDVGLTAATRCVAGKAQVTGTAQNIDTIPMTVVLTSPYGSATVSAVQPTKSAFHAFTTRLVTVPAGSVTVTATGVVNGAEVTATKTVTYPARTCG